MTERPMSMAALPAEEQKQTGKIRKFSWNTIKKERLSDFLSRQVVFGEKGTLSQMFVKRGAAVACHSHVNEEYLLVTSGALKFMVDDQEVVVKAAEGLVIPPNVPHSVVALEDGAFLEFWTPVREDWLRGEDQYLRGSVSV